MKIEFSIAENDFLTHQLFLASRSERIKKKRKRSQRRIPLIYLVFMLICLFLGNYTASIVFLVIALLWFLFYPQWERNYYIKHYRAHVKEQYKDRFEKMVSMEFHKDFIFVKENGAESKVFTTELEEIVEIPSMIICVLKGGLSFIIPTEKLSNLLDFRLRLKELTKDVNIPYYMDEQWKWK